MHPNPGFREVYDCLQRHGPARVVSSRGTEYEVVARPVRGVPAIIGFLEDRSARVTVHEDCWGADITCQKTRAGGLYHGSPSIFDWYREHRGK